MLQPIQIIFLISFNRTSMESKLHLKLITLIIFQAFNRTSMESKLRPVVCPVPRHRCLLIEPVWNRNLKKASVLYALLYSFNRTSMESKLVSDSRASSIPSCSFNRTSMESKLPPAFSLSSLCLLLIEPVWNRNVSASRSNEPSCCNF